MNSVDPNAIKYLVKAKITADGVVDKPDVVGAVFGQTEGLLGDDLDLRDLQKSGRIGRIEVDITCKGGKSEGLILMYSSLDQVETSIISAALETIDRVGPCKAQVKVLEIEDIRIAKRDKIINRAKELLTEMVEQARDSGSNLASNIRQSVQVEEITTYGKERLPAGPKVKDSEAIIIVEGRSDVLNLLRAGIKNAIAVEGTNIPKSVQDLSRERVTTAFVDGDRGGELILRELFQTSEIDFVARAPRSQEVEELTAKALVKCLRNKVPGDQYMEMNNLRVDDSDSEDDDNHFDEDRSHRGDRHQRDRRDRRQRDYRDDDEGHNRNRRDRHQRDYSDDEEGNYRSRRNQRFDTEASDRYKKRNYDSEEEEKESDSTSNFDSEQETTEYEQSASNETVEAGEFNTDSAESNVEEETEDNKTARIGKTGRGKKKSKAEIPQQDVLGEILNGVMGTRNAVLLDSANTEIGKIQVKELADYLVGSDAPAGIAAIVSDGVVGQRLVDVAAEKNITILIGKKKGKITNQPQEISVWTKDDFS